MKIPTSTKFVLGVSEGRGLVVSAAGNHLVITAAHCLPGFPPCYSASGLEDRTYKKLLGPLGTQPSVTAQCLFVDPISDVAVLGCPDTQAQDRDARAYENL